MQGKYTEFYLITLQLMLLYETHYLLTTIKITINLNLNFYQGAWDIVTT